MHHTTPNANDYEKIETYIHVCLLSKKLKRTSCYQIDEFVLYYKTLTYTTAWL